MNWYELSAISAILVVCLTILRDVFNGSWSLSRKLAEMETRLLTELQKHKDGSVEAIAKMESDCESRSRELRDRLHQIETWARDEFVRKTSFDTALQKIEKWLERMDQKLDAVRGMHNPPPPSA